MMGLQSQRPSALIPQHGDQNKDFLRAQHAWPFHSWPPAFKDTLKPKVPTFEKINPRDAASQLVTGWMEVSDVILIPFKFIFFLTITFK